MTKLQRISTIVLLGMSVSFLAAQEKSCIAFDFDLAIDSTAWRYSDNASQLYRMPVDVTGRAYLGADQGWGNTLQYNQAEKIRDYFLSSEAYFRLSPVAMLYGRASFSSGTESNVVGSAFLNSEDMPFDITYLDDTNIGDRKIERYNIMGAVGYKVTKGLAVGALMDYTAINGARTKDLRHTNKVLSLDVSGGLSYVFSKFFTLGAHYKYRRYIESVSFNVYGVSEQPYFTLINYGAFCGVQELFDTSGYARKSSNTPFAENTHHVGLQLDWRLGTFRIYNELVWSDLSGYYGKKGTANVQFTEHSGNQFEERLNLSFTGACIYQSLTLGLHSRKTENYENLWRSETGTNGNSIIKYYGNNLVGRKKLTTLDAQYYIGWGNINNAPVWAFKVASSIEKRETTGILYPYYRKQDLNLYVQRVEAVHQLNWHKLNMMFNLQLAYLSGSGDKAIDGVYVTPSSDTGSPRYQNEFLDREYAYLTADRLVPGLNVRLTLPIGSMHYFLQMGYTHELFLKSRIVDKNNQSLHARIGINF